jgi:predicted dehydrogenase
MMVFQRRNLLWKPYDDPFTLFAAVINGNLTLGPFDPYSLENNMITMEILDAAVQSAKTQSTVQLKK